MGYNGNARKSDNYSSYMSGKQKKNIQKTQGAYNIYAERKTRQRNTTTNSHPQEIRRNKNHINEYEDVITHDRQNLNFQEKPIRIQPNLYRVPQIKTYRDAHRWRRKVLETNVENMGNLRTTIQMRKIANWNMKSKN